MLTREFINTVFVAELREMTMNRKGNASHPYVGFSLICQSIEVLGACFDEFEWEDRNLSELRFRLAILKLFSKKYWQFNGKKSKFDLYKNLRCPMIHQLRPGRYISLSERRHEKMAGIKNAHLRIQKGKLLLIYEDFLNDFINASKKLISIIDKGKLQSEKVFGHRILIPSDKKRS